MVAERKYGESPITTHGRAQRSTGHNEVPHGITKAADPGSYSSRGDKKKAYLCIFGNWKGVEATKIFLLDHGLY